MRRRRDLALVAALGAAGWAVYRLERIAFLLTLAMFFAYVIAPIVQRAERPIRRRALNGGAGARLPQSVSGNARLATAAVLFCTCRWRRVT
jgi:hypothetical protein